MYRSKQSANVIHIENRPTIFNPQTSRISRRINTHLGCSKTFFLSCFLTKAVMKIGPFHQRFAVITLLVIATYIQHGQLNSKLLSKKYILCTKSQYFSQEKQWYSFHFDPENGFGVPWFQSSNVLNVCVTKILIFIEHVILN